jgi:two-component system, sensor histidine kinase and response regulator
MSSVLIVDDNRHIRTQINLVLKLEGYETVEAENGIQAVSMAKELRPDLIVCDIIMPEMDGYGVLERLRGNGETADTPFLFLSAKADKSDVREGMNLGADDYLVKPFSAQELVQAISARISRQQVTRRKWERRVESLSELSASKDRFMTLMSHDLKTAFAGVMGLSEMLSSKLDDLALDRLQEISGLMNDAVQSTHNLLQSFVEWSRLQASGMKPVIEPVNIGELAYGLILQQSTFAAHKNITIVNTIPHDTHVAADYNMIQVVVRNLLSNALKFTPLGGTVTLSASASASARQTDAPAFDSEPASTLAPALAPAQALEIAVTDTGVGMSADSVERLMRLDIANGIQFSTPGTQGEKGTGLGVMFCRELLDKQDSSLRIASTQGKGSTFSFVLPTARQE